MDTRKLIPLAKTKFLHHCAMCPPAVECLPLLVFTLAGQFNYPPLPASLFIQVPSPPFDEKNTAVKNVMPSYLTCLVELEESSMIRRVEGRSEQKPFFRL